MTSGIKASVYRALGGALAIAAVSTLGDFIWASWMLEHRPAYGLTHGSLLFLSIGLYLGALARRPVFGALTGAAIGFSAAGGFYLIAPILGRSAMFLIYFATWIALGVLNEYLTRRETAGINIRSALGRGVLAAVGSGLAFFLVSGIWRPFDPQGWDYLTHFGAWTLAYLPGFSALLVAKPK
jgi:hypothetical protein